MWGSYGLRKKLLIVLAYSSRITTRLPWINLGIKNQNNLGTSDWNESSEIPSEYGSETFNI